MKNFGSFLPSVEAVRLRAEVTKTVFAANQNMPECRRVTPGAADTVVERSLVASAGLPESLRHHLALVALSNYVSLAQHDRSRGEFAVDTDLLPVAHPRSTRPHAMTASALRESRARWIVSDPRIDEDHRPLVAAALTAEPGSVEHFYAVSRLEAAQDGIALRALLASFGDGNSSAARSARARLQRRDRKGRFAYQGGGMSLNVRLPGGGVQSFTGRYVRDSDSGDFFEIETPDGSLWQVPASKAEGRKGYLPREGGDGYAGVPANISSEDADTVVEQSELVRLDSPSGYRLDTDEDGTQNFVTNEEDYRVSVSQNEDGSKSFIVSRMDDDNTEVGQFKNWAEAHRALVNDGKRANKADAVKARLGGSKGRDAEYNDFKGGLEAEADDPDGDYRKAAKAALDYFEFGDTPEGESAAQLADRLEKNAAAAAADGDEDLAEDLRDAAEEVRYRAARGAANDAADTAPEFEVPEGAFALKRADINDFTPRGRTNQDSPDYTDDPAELAQRFDADTLREGLADALNGNGQGVMPFEQDEKVPAAALYKALQEKGLDADLETARIYDAAAGNDNNERAISESRESSEEKASLPEAEPVAQIPAPETVVELPDESPEPEPETVPSPDMVETVPSPQDETRLDPDINRDSDVENTAAKLHDIWREGRKNEDGSYEPRMKDDGAGGEVDIANTDYADLPEKWQAENRASADHVVNLLRDEQAPAGADPMEWAAEEVHKSWLERNGSWAPEEQKLPYSELSEEEKQKDRDVVQAALDTLGLDSPKQEATPEKPEGDATSEPVAELPEAPEAQGPKPFETSKPPKPLGTPRSTQTYSPNKSTAEMSDEELDAAIEEMENPDNAPNIIDGGGSLRNYYARLKQLRAERKMRDEGISTKNRIAAHDLMEKINGIDASLDPLPFQKKPNGEERRALNDERATLVAELEALVGEGYVNKTSKWGGFGTPSNAPGGQTPPTNKPSIPRKPRPSTSPSTPPAAPEGPDGRIPEGGASPTDEPNGRNRQGQRNAVINLKEATDQELLDALGNPDTDPIWRNAIENEQKIRAAGLDEIDSDVARSLNADIHEAERVYTGVPPEDERREGLIAEAEDLQTRLDDYLANDGTFPGDEGLKPEEPADAGEGTPPEEPPAVPEEGTPSPAQRITVAARDLQPGDVAVTDRNGNREYFIIDEVREGGEKGKMVVIGHYPGHQQQEKQWKGGTKISVVRGADVPPPGDGPEIHKPDIKEYLEKDEDGNVKKGQWVKDENGEWYVPDPEKQAEYKAAMDAALVDIFNASRGFNDPTRGETVPPAPKPLKAPFAPGAAPLQGRLAEIAREANGDPQKMRELLSQENVYVFDFETTGIEKDEFGAMVSPGQPWSIAVSKIDPMTGEVIETRSIFMNPGTPLGDWAKANLKDSDGNPLTDEWLATQRSKEDAFREALDFIGPDAILIGHNIDFDEPILRENADEYDLPYAPAGLGDTMSLSRYLQREDKYSKNKLGDLADKYGIENPDWHNAENDVATTAKIFDALLNDFQERDEPIDMDAIEEWQRGRDEEFDAKQKKFADDLAQRKADELVAQALHSEEKPDVDKAVSEIAEEIKAAENTPAEPADDEDVESFLPEDEEEIRGERVEDFGPRPDVVEEKPYGVVPGSRFILSNGDQISVVPDPFGDGFETAYMHRDDRDAGDWRVRHWNAQTPEEALRLHLEEIYGVQDRAPESIVDPDIDSSVPDNVEVEESGLPLREWLNREADPALLEIDVVDENNDGSEIKELVQEARDRREAMNAAKDAKTLLDEAGKFADALEDLADAADGENDLNEYANNIRAAMRDLRRNERRRARGRDVRRPTPSPEKPADAPENIEQEVPTRGPVPERATDNGGIPANEPTSVDGVGDFGVGVRTPAAPGDRPTGITNGKDLPGAMPAGPDEPQGPDGRRLLRRGRENRRFWDHPLFERWLNGGRAVFNRPWEGQFVDRNNIPLAAGDKVQYIGPGKNKGQVGIIIGREDNVERENGLNRDYVLVRFENGREALLKSRNFVLDPNEDTGWRFLVNPDEVPNDPAEERINLPAGFDWDQVRRGAAPQNTRGKNGELRGEGRDANNVPIAPGDALAQQERHELEGHLADDDGFILFEGDRVQIVKGVKNLEPVYGRVIGKKYMPRYRDGQRVGFGYYALIQLDNGTIVPRSAKSLRILDVPDNDKAARRPDNPKASLPALKKEGSQWVPDEIGEGEPPVRAVPPRKATVQNAAFTAAGDLAQVLDYQIAPNLRGQDFIQQAQELRERAEALRVLIDNGAEDQVVGEAVRDLADAAHVFGDRIRADRDNNAEINGKNPADALNGFGDNFEMLADGLTTSPKPRRGKWMPDGLEHRTDLTEDQVRVGDFVSLPNVGGAKVIEITNNDGLQQRSFLVEDEAGRRTVLVTGYGAKFPVPVIRKLDKNAKPDPFIPRNVKRMDIPASQIQVGDFVPMSNGNYGLVISKEVSDRNGAVKFKFRFENGREWEPKWWSGSKMNNGVLRAPAENNDQRPETPIQQMEVSPTPPPNPGAPVLDRNGRALSVGQRVVHNNKKKAEELGEGVIEGFEKDPKYGKDVVRVRFADGLKRFRADRVFGQEDNNQNNNNNNNRARPAQQYAAALGLLDQKIPADKRANIKDVLENGGDLSDLDPKTQALIKKAFPRAAKELNNRGDKQGLQNLAELVFELNKMHVEKHPAPESLGVGEELFDLDLDDIVEQFKNFPGKYDRYGNFMPGVEIPLVDKAGNPIPGWHAETLKMGAIGYTFFMVHESGQRFVLKKETKLETAAKEVVGAAMARGLGIPGATYAELYPKNKYISIQTFAGATEPLPSDGFGKMGRNMDANDFNDVPIDNIIRMILLDALSDNPDRHGGNYLYGEIVNDGEREVHVYPIDAGLGSFGTGRVTPLTVQTRFNGRQWGASRFDELGAFTTKEIAKMSLQELIQYLNRYAGPGVSDANVRNFAERMLERAKNAIADGISYGVFR